MKTKVCPECNEDLNDYARACACGWRESSKKKIKLSGIKQCAFSDNGIRCPLPATVDDYTCRHHFNFWDNPRLAALNLQDILNNKVNQKYNWRQEVIEEFQKEHPEFSVIPESREDVETMLDMVKRFKPINLPYEKNKQLA